MELLPDSRLKRLTPKTVPHKEWGTAQQIFCANCGKDGGLIPEQNSTFAFYLCDECWEVHGSLTEFLAIPESEVRRDARLRQLEKSNQRGAGVSQC